MARTSYVSGPVPRENKSAKPNLVAIGTRGTVGSLFKKEIDYFTRPCSNNDQRSHDLALCSASSVKFSDPKIESTINNIARKKKKRGSNRLIPSMCAMVEVVERNQTSGFTYRNLKADLKRGSIY
ncbi:uncharacterized protein [Henckelia pumila]|uniref:uncharacterized protein n=1 Tax=Henckelia pumila TaxID=405737 RepID=UPI003C6E2AE4